MGIIDHCCVGGDFFRIVLFFTTMNNILNIPSSRFKPNIFSYISFVCKMVLETTLQVRHEATRNRILFGFH